MLLLYFQLYILHNFQHLSYNIWSCNVEFPFRFYNVVSFILYYNIVSNMIYSVILHSVMALTSIMISIAE